jgi:SAM-dependent methyltransferase
MGRSPARPRPHLPTGSNPATRRLAASAALGPGIDTAVQAAGSACLGPWPPADHENPSGTYRFHLLNGIASSISAAVPACDGCRCARIASVINVAWDHNSYYHERLLRALPARCGRVLDVGCGAGRFAARLAERADQVDALDRSPAMIAEAQRIVPANVTCLLGDAATGDLPGGAYDAVTSISALHHMDLPAEAVSVVGYGARGAVLLCLPAGRRYRREMYQLRAAQAPGAGQGPAPVPTAGPRPGRGSPARIPGAVACPLAVRAQLAQARPVTAIAGYLSVELTGRADAQHRRAPRVVLRS